MNKENRSYNSKIEIRENTDSRVIEGQPIVFDKLSENLGGFVERVDKKALEDVDLSKVLLIYGHEFNSILARVDAGNLKLEVTDSGLNFKAELPNTTLANDALENIRVGNIQGMSFGFTVEEDEWTYGDRGQPDTRVIKKIDEVFEITLTPIPAYTDTKIAIASRDANKKVIDRRLAYQQILKSKKELL